MSTLNNEDWKCILEAVIYREIGLELRAQDFAKWIILEDKIKDILLNRKD